MKVLLFGSSGMVGQGVLREALLAPDVTQVAIVVRSPSGQRHEKLREIVAPDLFDVRSIEPQLSGFDACFFCLGVSSSGMTEEAYSRITYELTMALARPLAARNPNMVFIYVSGAGTDSTEHGRIMWARVKGRTENELLRLPFRQAVMFRPAMIQPMHGVVSKTKSYRLFYRYLGWILPLLKRIMPGSVTTTEQVGRAMLEVARHGAPKPLLESIDIDRL